MGSAYTKMKGETMMGDTITIQELKGKYLQALTTEVEYAIIIKDLQTSEISERYRLLEAWEIYGAATEFLYKFKRLSPDLAGDWHEDWWDGYYTKGIEYIYDFSDLSMVEFKEKYGLL